MLIIKVIDALEAHRLGYAIVGGYAVALHGALRGTVDVDIVIQLTQSAFRKAEQAMRSIGLEPRLPVTADEVFTYRDEYIKNRNLIAWSFINPSTPSEIVDIIITENLAKIKTVTKTSFGKRIKVIAIQDLIAMKQLSNRPQDKADVKALKALQ